MVGVGLRLLPTAFILAMFVLAACNRQPVPDEKPIGIRIHEKAPLGLPPVPVPADNPLTAEGVALGRRLFYERRLSLDNSLSCASCHDPERGFSDPRPHSMGIGGQFGTRNAPTLINAAYMPLLFWDGRAASLEAQSGGPMANPIEMGLKHEVLVSRINSDASYRAEFERAFGPGAVTLGKVEKALASFERTLISGNSAFDRYEYGGDKTALSPAAIRGFSVFLNPQKGNCVTCHTVGSKYALFTDGKFHNTGAGVDGEGTLLDVGRFEETKREVDRGSFKTPSLRNVALSAPYMHDGSLKTLHDVVDFYAGGGNSNASQDAAMKKIHLTGQDRADLVAFLQSLTGDTRLQTAQETRASR